MAEEGIPPEDQTEVDGLFGGSNDEEQQPPTPTYVGDDRVPQSPKLETPNTPLSTDVAETDKDQMKAILEKKRATAIRAENRNIPADDDPGAQSSKPPAKAKGKAKAKANAKAGTWLGREKSEALVPYTRGSKVYNSEEDAVDLPPGEVDTRKTSRAQRAVFEKAQNVPPEVWERYLWLKNLKIRWQASAMR